MDDNNFHLLRTRLDSMLTGQELTSAQAETLVGTIRARLEPGGITVYAPLGDPEGFGPPPEPRKRKTGRRGRPKGSKNKAKARKAGRRARK